MHNPEFGRAACAQYKSRVSFEQVLLYEATL